MRRRQGRTKKGSVMKDERFEGGGERRPGGDYIADELTKRKAARELDVKVTILVTQYGFGQELVETEKYSRFIK